MGEYIIMCVGLGGRRREGVKEGGTQGERVKIPQGGKRGWICCKTQVKKDVCAYVLDIQYIYTTCMYTTYMLVELYKMQTKCQ